VLLLSASLLTASRGGFLSLAVALAVVLLLVVLITRPRVAVGASAVLAAAAIGAVLVWLSGSTLLERLDQGQDAARLPIYQDTFDMIAARPWTGHGYGTYEQSFKLYQDRSAGPFLVDKAHNSYLEHLSELGIPATVLLYLGPFILFLFCLRGVFVRRKDKIFPLLAASATVLVAVHALVDFSLQIPAVAVAYAVILGMGVAQSVPSPQAKGPGASLRD
jgi:O-antigen ligase